MHRPKGLPKTGGRKPGSLNKRTILFADVLEGLKFSIPQKAVELYEHLPCDLKLDCLKFLASFSHPKPVEREFSLSVMNSQDTTAVEKLSDQEIMRLASGSNTDSK